MAAEAQRRLEPALSEEVRGRQPASCHGKFHCIWLSGECKIRIGTGDCPSYGAINKASRQFGKRLCEVRYAAEHATFHE